ncbi:MAG: M23 family metallopeptidase [Clostridia bacterium]|nr:M23 family metallopeptidase [Clostridia bacterium]
MKKQFVNGYGGKQKDGFVTLILVAVCVFTIVITIVAARLIIGSSAMDTTEQITAQTPETEEEVVFKDEFEEPEESVEVAAEPTGPQDDSEDGFSAPCGGPLLKEYSMTMPLYSETLDDWRVHSGIDISASLGADVLAVSDGVVADAYNDFRNGCTVVIEHDNGISSVYSNLADTEHVSKGQTVFEGDVIGKVGDTTLFETVADTHLHMEILLNGEHVNPLDYFELTE